jgi:hypothetical protein
MSAGEILAGEGGRLLSNVPHSQYLADAIPGFPGPYFSRSSALEILTESPLHAWLRHPLFGNQPKPHKSATGTGSLIHAALLGLGPEVVIVKIHGNKNEIGPLRYADDFKTDEAKRIKRETLARGALPILQKDYEAVEVAVSILRKRLEELGVPLPDNHPDCLAESTLLWVDDGVACKCRPDIILTGHGAPIVWDPKTTGGGTRPPLNPASWRAGMVRYGNDIQWHTATSALGAIFPEFAGRVEMNYVVMQAVPPYDAWIQPVGKTMQSLGADRWRRSRDAWRSALESGVWPGSGIQAPAEAKPWDLEQEFVAAVAAAGEPDWAKED